MTRLMIPRSRAVETAKMIAVKQPVIRPKIAIDGVK